MQVYECLNMAKLPALNIDGASAAKEQPKESRAATLFGGGTWGLSTVNS